MRVAKSNQLRRLLQLQDVVLSTVLYALCVDSFWLLGELTLDAAINHLRLIGFVLALSVIASNLHNPRLHGQSTEDFCLYAARYACIVVLGFAVVVFLSGIDWAHRGLLVAYFCSTTPILIANRIFLRWWYLQGRREHRANYIKVVVVGSGSRAKRLIDVYSRYVDWAVEIVACVEPDESATIGLTGDFRFVRGLDEFDQLLATEVIDEVVVCLPRSMMSKLPPITKACEEQGICLKYMADVYDASAERFSLENVGGVPIINIEPVVVGTGQLVLKRLVDLTLTIILTFVLSPIFVLIVIAIKLDSVGPIFFKQRRVGLNKRPFQMYKFRSMGLGAEGEIINMEHLNEASGPIFKIANDPRVTRVGRVLRRFSLDELPQLYNVLLGHMSVIGPRPMSVRDVGKFDRSKQQRRFSVRPGLACLREIEGRSNLSFDRWLELDLLYIDTWSFALDFKILLKLIPAVLSGRGAS